jgi:branched-chain amino acid transport system ATP-binding protein
MIVTAAKAQGAPAPIKEPVAAIELVGLEKRFGRTEIIRGVDLKITTGERHAVIGPNGAGKSTLFNLISGRLRPTFGVVLLKGQNITELAPHHINRLGLARSFQVTNIFPKLTVFENIRTGCLWSQGAGYAFWRAVSGMRKANARADEILDQIGLAGRRDATAGVLTYAEQRALEIGVTIAGGADIIILDEPTAGMSVAEAEHAVALIRKVTAGKTLVVIEHDMGVVFGLADRISVLVYGKVIATDLPHRIKANAAVQEAYLGVLPVAAPAQPVPPAGEWNGVR